MDPKRTPRLFLLATACAALLGAGIFFAATRHPAPAAPPAASEADGMDVQAGEVGGPLALQVPLETTADDRKAFQAELEKTLKEKGYDLRALYEAWIGRIGANGIIATLTAVNPYCHDEAHDLGKVIYAKTQDVGLALRSCQDACYSGCMHGVMMQLFALSDGAPKPSAGGGADDDDHIYAKDVVGRISTICKTGEMAARYKEGDCIHGVGHALMYLADYDIDKAMSLCDAFSTQPERYYCATGAYMEYVTTHDAKDASQADPLAPCDAEPYPAACFRYKMVHVYDRLYAAHGNPLDIVNRCLALDGKYQLGCFHGIGNAHMGFIAEGRLKLSALCAYGTHDDQYTCIEGAMERLAKYHPEAVAKACATVSGWQRDLCETAASHDLYDLAKPFDLYPR